ncbi:hypothetical protein CPB85DRAFT_1371764 [Mucidula mucida]|nr:hypothetical protein CPB85DRAFT_1371764 [Mucidula mucida]
MLLPLLPKPKPHKALPSEIWTEIFKFVLEARAEMNKYGVLRVSATALPLAYKRVHIHIYRRLYDAEKKWDSIRRIPYSAPGRVFPFVDHAQTFLIDSLLTPLFPLVPCLTHLSMNPLFVMSRRAITSLACRPGVSEEESVVTLLRCCEHLEELEITGHSPDPSDLDWTAFEDAETYASRRPLFLPHLRVLTLLSIHSSPLLSTLLISHLPSLEKLTITPYDDLPGSPVSQFIETHGADLRSLLLFTPKSWPTRLHPSPDSILNTSPNLRHMSLEQPLPTLAIKGNHPLQFLSIPRPNNDSWAFLARLLPHVPNLCAVRARDVKWLRKGMNSVAQEAGVQGTMREWRKRLARRGVRMLDSDWKDIEL